MFKFQIIPFNELTTLQLYAILALRCKVFVVEQNGVYQDMDGKDLHADHLLAFQDDELVGYLRLLPVGISYPNYLSIGRVVSAPHVRGLGLGKQLMTQALSYFVQHYRDKTIKISAQHYLQRFYEEFGFTAQGNVYQEDNIPHIAMLLKI